MDEPWVLLVNPSAGPFRRWRSPERLVACARRAGVSLRVSVTLTGAQMRRRIRRALAGGTRRIAVAGGDGTVSHAAQELVGCDAVLGILAIGTDNNFARSVGIPMGLTAGLERLRDGEPASVSVGQMGDRYFIESAGAGVFADLLDSYGPASGRSLPRACASLLRVMRSLPPPELEVTLDGRALDRPVGLCIAANVARLGPGACIAPEARVDDGWLDIVTTDVCGTAEMLRALAALWLGRRGRSPAVHHALARDVTIASRARVRVYCDDRVVGVTPARLGLVGAALQVAGADGARAAHRWPVRPPR